MNYQNYKITDFIFKLSNGIHHSLCDHIIQKSANYSWQKHGWYGTNASSTNGELKLKDLNNNYAYKQGDDKDFLRTELDKIVHLQINPIIEKGIEEYKRHCNIEPPLLFKSPIQLNKYGEGTRMRQHFDHIYSCFDGEKKGIPVISVVGLLNDDFTGGEFIFWDDYKIDLKKGDLLFFPSLFIYPHKVSLVTSGERYSIVTWVW